MESLVEERNRILKIYEKDKEKDKTYKKICGILLILVVISFVSSFCFYIGSNLCNKYILEVDKVLLLFKIFYIVLSIMLVGLIFSKPNKDLVKYCILLSVLSGKLYRNVFCQSISAIIPNMLLLIIPIILIINVEKVRKIFFRKFHEYGYYALYIFFMFMFLLHLTQHIALINMLIFLICIIYFFILTLILCKKLSNEEKFEKHDMIIYATRLFIILPVCIRVLL